MPRHVPDVLAIPGTGDEGKTMSMTQAEVQNLFLQFAAPLGAYAAITPDRKPLAEMLVKHLWAAMIAGPRMEEETWELLKTHAHLGAEDIKPIQEVYYQEMKPAVSSEQLSALRERYNIQPKE